MKSKFVIRVYGIYINENQELLLSDELVYGQYITKFPGGGLEFGEGLIECIKREMLEETGQEFKVLQHFYTTDFFVQSAFDPDVQVISVYYRISPKAALQLKMSEKKIDFVKPVDGAQSFRWVQISALKKSDLSLPIDQKVAEMLIKLSM